MYICRVCSQITDISSSDLGLNSVLMGIAENKGKFNQAWFINQNIQFSKERRHVSEFIIFHFYIMLLHI